MFCAETKEEVWGSCYCKIQIQESKRKKKCVVKKNHKKCQNFCHWKKTLTKKNIGKTYVRSNDWFFGKETLTKKEKKSAIYWILIHIVVWEIKRYCS